jgi:site-specific recombinase XerD
MNNLINLQNEITTTSQFDFSGLEQKFFEMLDVKETTFNTYKASLKSFFGFCKENEIFEPETKDIILYKKFLQENKKEGATINLRLSSLKRFFKFLEQNGLYKDIARCIEGVKFNKYDKKDCLTKEQVKELLSWCNTETIKGLRDRAIIALMATCGLRDVEITEIIEDDFFMFDGKHCLMVHGKGRNEKDEQVFVPEITYNMIQEYLAKRTVKSEFVFISSSNNCNGKIRKESVSRLIKTALRAIGLDSKRLTAHSLRHTAVTMALKSNMDIEEVKDFARHRNIATTQIYNHNLKIKENKLKCSNAVSNFLFG